MYNMQDRGVQPEARPVIRPERKHALLLVLIALAGLFVASMLTNAVLPENMNVQLQLLLSNLLYYGLFLALPIALVMRRRGSLEAMRPNPIAPGDVFLIIPLAILGVLLVSYLITLWAIPLQKIGLDIYAVSTVPAAQNTRELALSILSVAVLPGVCEELLFRGAVLPVYEECGTKRAVFITAALFTLLHGSVSGLPSQFLLGLIMGAVVVMTDSIYAGIIYHTVHNAVLMIWQYVQENMVRGAAEAAEGDILASIGGATGIAVLLFSIAQLALWMGLILMVMRRRARRRGLQIQPPERRGISRGEALLLAGVIVLAGILYLLDMLVMAGGLV